MAKVGSSAAVGVVIFKTSIFDLLVSPSDKISFSVKFGVAVFKESIPNSLGGPPAKVCSSAKFCVVVFKASLLYYPGGHLPSFEYQFSRNLCSMTWGLHLPKYVCLPSFV